MLLPYLLKVSLLLAVLTLGYRWLIQFETFSRLNRVLLWFNVLAAWSLPLIPLADWGPVAVQQQFYEVSRTQLGTDLSTTLEVELPQAAPIDFSAELVADSPSLGQFVSAWGATDWLLLIYGLGVIVLLTRFLYQLGRLVLSLRGHPAEPLTNGLWLVQNPATASPFSLFNWIVCDPARHGPAELRQIIAHETEHARGGHSFDLLLAEVQRIALWVNPFAWVHQKLVQENLEYLADRAVLQAGFAKKEYQLNILSAIVPIHEPPLTTSFAQSLLKKRIKMMNRKPSQSWVLGKYAALIAVLYLSSAFVAPYREQIIDLVPRITQPVIGDLLENTDTTEEAKEVVTTIVEIPVLEKSAEVMLPVKEDSGFAPKSKWIQMEGDKLFWAIPSTVTWEELSEMKQDVKNFGNIMTVINLKYDPLQKFLTAIRVRMDKPNGGSGEGGGEEDDYTPFKGYSGYITQSGRGMGQLPPEPLLSRFNESYQSALALKKENELEYIEQKLGKELSEKLGNFGTRENTRKFIEKVKIGETMGEGEWSNFGRSTDNTLKIGDKFKSAEFYINGKPATIKEMNKVPYDKIQKLNISSDNKNNYFIAVYIK